MHHDLVLKIALETKVEEQYRKHGSCTLSSRALELALPFILTSSESSAAAEFVDSHSYSTQAFNMAAVRAAQSPVPNNGIYHENPNKQSQMVEDSSDAHTPVTNGSDSRTYNPPPNSFSVREQPGSSDRLPNGLADFFKYSNHWSIYVIYLDIIAPRSSRLYCTIQQLPIVF